MKSNVIALLLGMLVCVPQVHAQLNLKRKLEKKADQEIDEFLFGKKKRKNETTTDIPGNMGGGGDESSSSKSTSKYKPKDADFGAVNADELIHFTILIDFLPEEVRGYVRNAEPDGSIYKSANFNISMGTKTYDKGGKEMTLSVFDYKDAAMLYSGQASQYFEYESTDGYTKAVEVRGYSGWVSKDYDDGTATLFLGIKDRYIVTMEADDAEQSEMEAVVGELPLEQLP